MKKKIDKGIKSIKSKIRAFWQNIKTSEEAQDMRQNSKATFYKKNFHE